MRAVHGRWFLFVALLATAGPAAGEERPWRLREAVGSPAWLRFGLESRLRVEHLAEDFRISAPGDSSALFLRSLLQAELELSPLILGAELMDARVWASEGTPLNPTLGNPLEPLQLYLRLEASDLIARGDRGWATLGRMTLDVGSRRLIARNEFRNTINAFTGLELGWRSEHDGLLRAFAVLPITRLPSEPERLAQNRVELDREGFETLLLGLYHRSPPLSGGWRLEAYVFGLLERDAAPVETADRRLLTPGARLWRAPAAGETDLEIELMLQLGTSRASMAPTDTHDLAHQALAVHLSLGHSLVAPGSPRVVLGYDYASGDHAPHDRRNQRFDPLFAARRFELGPTGLYGALPRSNLSAPGLRLELSPHPRLDAFAAYRLAWLASAKDAWTVAGLVAPDGSADTFVGHQLEARARWHVWPGNLSLDLGGAGLARGAFARETPGAKAGTPVYVYAQLTGNL